MLQSNFDALKTAIVDFHKATGIMMTLYDEQFRQLYCYPPDHSVFCAEVRRSESLREKCTACDTAALERCRATKKPMIYRCHMGLIEAVAPIPVLDSVAGYLMMGQVLPEHQRDEPCSIIDALPNGEVPSKEVLIRALSAMQPLSHEKLLAAAHIMEMCTCYISLHNFMMSQQTPLRLQIEQYVEAHLEEPSLSLKTICHAFLISRSALYELSKTAYGVGISDYIRGQRIERAKKLLLRKKMSVAEVSRACGFRDPGFFTKTFRSVTGVLPKHYADSVSRR